MRYQMEECIPDERAYRQGNEKLKQVVVKDLLHDGYHGNSEQADQTYDDYREESITPHCNVKQVLKDIS